MGDARPAAPPAAGAPPGRAPLDPSDVSRLVRRQRQPDRPAFGLDRGERLLVLLAITGLVTVALSLVYSLYGGADSPHGLTVALHVAAGLTLAGMLAAALSLVQRATLRLRRLRDVATDLGVGDLSARAPTDPLDDYGHLGLALNVMADRIGRLLQAQRDLLSGVSHELRSPLARIEVALELIRREFEAAREQAPDGIDSRRSEGEQLVEEIVEEVRLLERHIARLLEAQRVGSEGALPRRAAMVLDALVQRVLDRERLRLQSLGWSVELALSLGDARLMGDDNALDRLVSTLVENAVQHAGDGVDATGRAAERALRVETLRDDQGRALLRVMDRGVGIAEAEIQNVFEAFFRTDRSRSTRTGGTGLGLYLVKRIAEAHGGQARAAPRPGGGVVVEVALPLLGQARDVKETIRMSLDPADR